MTRFSPAIAGANVTAAASFSFAFNGSGGAATAKALMLGGYILQADQDVLIKVAPTSGLVAVQALPASQGAVGDAAGGRTIRVRAGTDYPLDVPADNMSISVLGFTTTAGTLTVNGPITFSQVT